MVPLPVPAPQPASQPPAAAAPNNNNNSNTNAKRRVAAPGATAQSRNALKKMLDKLGLLDLDLKGASVPTASDDAKPQSYIESQRDFLNQIKLRPTSTPPQHASLQAAAVYTQQQQQQQQPSTPTSSSFPLAGGSSPGLPPSYYAFVKGNTPPGVSMMISPQRAPVGDTGARPQDAVLAHPGSVRNLYPQQLTGGASIVVGGGEPVESESALMPAAANAPTGQRTGAPLRPQSSFAGFGSAGGIMVVPEQGSESSQMHTTGGPPPLSKVCEQEQWFGSMRST